MILFDRVSFSYTENIETSLILKEVSFCIKKGTINGLIGSNGCGKSTIARLIVGLNKPTSGSISFSEENREDSLIYFPGLIFQNPENQIVGTTIGDDIAFGLENLNLPTDKIVSRVNEAASFFGFDDKLDFSVSNLSGGQKQMLCIASVLALEPNWIIFDEPTSHLDPWARLEFWNIINKIKNSNIGILIISQIPNDIENFERIIVLNDGKLIFCDDRSKFKGLDNPPKGVNFPDRWIYEKIKEKHEAKLK